MNFFKLIYLLSFWSFIDAKPAVFFDGERKQLVEVGEYADEVICIFCLSSCPASSSSKEENILNQTISITGNSMFVQQVYTTAINAMKRKADLCENRYSPALVYDTVQKSYNVGYEVYHKRGQKIALKCLQYDYYKKVNNGEINAKREEIVPTENAVKIEKEDGNTTFKMVVAERSSKYIFYWIQVLSFEMRNEQKHRIVTFTEDTINDYFNRHKTMHHCEFYYSGDGRTISDKDNQKKTEKVINRLVKAQIIPMQMFHTAAARLATCMYLNFAFVWEIIAKNQLKDIDLFIYALYRESPSETSIYFGVDGDLQDIDPIARNETNFEDQLFRKFSVPEKVFRIILIKNNYQYYGAVVVVHNDLEPVKYTDRVCFVKEEVSGWDYIQNMDSATGFSYVCPLKVTVLTKLHVESEPKMVHSKPLQIDKLSLFDEKTQKIRYGNVLDRVIRRLEDIKNFRLRDFSVTKFIHNY